MSDNAEIVARAKRHDDGDWVPASYLDCALCELAERRQTEGCELVCKRCPVYWARDGCPCDVPRADETESPWGYYQDTLDIRPMLKWLRRTKKILQEGKLDPPGWTGQADPLRVAGVENEE